MTLQTRSSERSAWFLLQLYQYRVLCGPSRSPIVHMREILRSTVRILASFFLLVVLAALGIYATRTYQLNQIYDVAVAGVAIPADSVAVLTR